MLDMVKKMIPSKLKGLLKLSDSSNFTTHDKSGITSKDIGFTGLGLGGIAGASLGQDPEKAMGERIKSQKKLLKKARPGDIILAGRVNYKTKGPMKILNGKLPLKEKMHQLGDFAFWEGMKPFTGSYTPHSILVERTKKRGLGIHQVAPTAERHFLRSAKSSKDGLIAGYDRLALVRPHASEKQISKAIEYGTSASRKRMKYSGPIAVSQSLMGFVLPKKIRDLVIKKKGKKNFCTGQTCSLFERAGAPIVKGKARSALAKDILSSKKVDVLGWAGKSITTKEKLITKYLPKTIKGIAAGTALGAASYGMAKLLKKKKTTN